MKTASKHSTKLPDKKTQDCLQWAGTAGTFGTLEMAMCVLDCSNIHDAAHRKAARVLSTYRALFDELTRSRSGSLWRMKAPENMPYGVLFPLSKWQGGIRVGAGWGFRMHDTSYSFDTIELARIGLIRNA